MEGASGTEFLASARDEVFEPLGLRHTVACGGSVGGTPLRLLVPAHELVVAGLVNLSGPSSEIVPEVARIFEEHLEGGR